MKQKKMVVNVVVALGLVLAPIGNGLQKAEASEREVMAIPALALAPIAYEMMLGITVLFGGSHYAYFADKIALPSVGDTFSLSRLRNLKNQTPKLTEAQHVDHMINNQLLKDYNALQTAIEFSNGENVGAELVETFINQYKTVCATLGTNNSGTCNLSLGLQSQMQDHGWDLSPVLTADNWRDNIRTQARKMRSHVESLSNRDPRKGCYAGSHGVFAKCGFSFLSKLRGIKYFWQHSMLPGFCRRLSEEFFEGCTKPAPWSFQSKCAHGYSRCIQTVKNMPDVIPSHQDLFGNSACLDGSLACKTY